MESLDVYAQLTNLNGKASSYFSILTPANSPDHLNRSNLAVSMCVCVSAWVLTHVIKDRTRCILPMHLDNNHWLGCGYCTLTSQGIFAPNFIFRGKCPRFSNFCLYSLPKGAWQVNLWKHSCLLLLKGNGVFISVFMSLSQSTFSSGSMKSLLFQISQAFVITYHVV